MYFRRYFKYYGFTLIELIIVIAIISVLVAGVFIAVNPAKRIGQAKDAERWADLNAIIQAIDNYTADNAALPIEFSSAVLNTKIVLCSASAELTCDGQATDCAVIDDSDFLGPYLLSLPVDPDKDDTTDTGYYMTVTSGNILTFGACDSYDTTNIPLVNSKTNAWTCGIDLVNPKDNLIYGSVNALDGNCWLDRNLGASRKATAYNDSQAYGYLYQWGRKTDGHQLTDSATTVTLSTTDSPGHGDFIISASSPNDWRSPKNDNLWQGESGTNNPCPNGWRLPTSAEWASIFSAEGITNYTTAYNSRLKLTAAGRRVDINGTVDLQGSYGYYWSSTVTGNNAYSTYFHSSGASSSFGATRARGASVRCIRA